MDRGVGAFRALRSLAVVGAIGILVAACGGGSTANQGTQLAADQTLRFPLNDDIGSFDPAFINAAVDAAFAQNLYDGLLKFDDNLNIVPDIAKEVPTTSNGGISSDGLTYTFKLRNDVKFSNGDKVTAKDVIYSWNRAAKAQGDYASDLDHVVGYKDVKGKKATTMSGLTSSDDYTLKVQLTEAAGFFLTEVAFNTAVTGVVSEKAVTAGGEDTWWTKPETLIGTGPYKMSARTPKQSLDFVPVDNWWGSPKPVLKKIHVDIIADLSSAIAKYDQNGFDNVGFGDMNGNIPPEDVLRIKAGPKSSELKFIQKTRTTWVGFNYEKGPFAGTAGKDLRKAFSLAIDRTKLVDVACSHGVTCSAATGGLISKGLRSTRPPRSSCYRAPIRTRPRSRAWSTSTIRAPSTRRSPKTSNRSGRITSVSRLTWPRRSARRSSRVAPRRSTPSSGTAGRPTTTTRRTGSTTCSSRMRATAAPATPTRKWTRWSRAQTPRRPRMRLPITRRRPR